MNQFLHCAYLTAKVVVGPPLLLHSLYPSKELILTKKVFNKLCLANIIGSRRSICSLTTANGFIEVGKSIHKGEREKVITFFNYSISFLAFCEHIFDEL